MFTLFAASYDCVSAERFFADLAWKDEVILLIDAAGHIQGFTTLAINPKGIAHPAGDILFSGDTIIDPAHWGSSELVRAFCRRAGEWRRESGRRLFWMLISKGHRTFLFLPLFSKRFFPSPSNAEDEWGAIADHAAERMFGGDWCGARGVVRFSQSQGQLKPELAETSWQRGNSPMVRFFLEKNPRFAKGDELVCLTELDAGNLKRAALRGFEQGMREEVPRCV
jgi:hypothetical protein